ncbi:MULTISPECIES: GntR family transcriptional regulator [Ramlibacter]|uniref:GntR family transcriptional regulator n=1 Tax=Ramlibacter aquaticus TaxID=2780094 RepID=A0ABR9SJU7_9BURK|nr:MULTISPECIES: GntR family transcriptional regulator [Ramlibacter]MBE7942646.1 GntR family transcriptional regulator [Ramlibacter aquaticus]
MQAGSTAPPRSRAEEVHARLKEDIADFRLVPGDRFSENGLCERLGVSRTPVRQALARLAQEGWVEVQSRSGWRVRPFDFARFEQLYELRLVLESAALQRLCEARPGAQDALLARLEARWGPSGDGPSSDGPQVAAWDEDFHGALVAAAGNAEMARMHGEIMERIRIVRRLDFTQPARIAATYAEHARILGAVRARRPDEALALLRGHISASQAEVRRITLHQVQLARERAGSPGAAG